MGIDDGKVTALERHLTASADNEIDAGGRLVLPPFTNIHMHIDKCLTSGDAVPPVVAVTVVVVPGATPRNP